MPSAVNPLSHHHHQPSMGMGLLSSAGSKITKVCLLLRLRLPRAACQDCKYEWAKKGTQRTDVDILLYSHSVHLTPLLGP